MIKVGLVAVAALFLTVGAVTSAPNEAKAELICPTLAAAKVDPLLKRVAQYPKQTKRLVSLYEEKMRGIQVRRGLSAALREKYKALYKLRIAMAYARLARMQKSAMQSATQLGCEELTATEAASEVCAFAYVVTPGVSHVTGGVQETMSRRQAIQESFLNYFVGRC